MKEEGGNGEQNIVRETKNGRIEEVKDRQFLRGKLQKRERFGDV